MPDAGHIVQVQWLVAMATVAAVEGEEEEENGEEQVEKGEKEEEGECLAAMWRYQDSLCSQTENQRATQCRQALVLSK